MDRARTIKVKDSSRTAKHAGLLYVHDTKPGISRVKKGKGFTYKMPDGSAVNQKMLKRIETLHIPPAWIDVWICPLENGHLQATGKDDRRRKQYLYHPKWREAQDQNKYDRMLVFASVLPVIRKAVERDLAKEGMPREKVLAAIVKIMEKTLIRIGNEEYARTNQSFGLTTLRNKHVEVEGKKIHFHFKGKSGVVHEVEINHPRLARIVRKCQDLPGQELFTYLDADKNLHDVGSTDVNAYLKEITGEEVTAKDFRTWYGSVHALQFLLDLDPCDKKTQRKKNVVQVVTQVSEHLRNTRAVCKKSYIFPGIFEKYLEEGRLNVSCHCGHSDDLKPEEHQLVHFLKSSFA